MPRPKKQHLKKRPDGRYACRYKDQWFYAASEDDALAQREAYKQAEKEGTLLKPSVTVEKYASAWLPIARPSVSDGTYHSLAIHLDHLVKHLGDLAMSDVLPLQIKEVYTSEYLGLSQSYIQAAKQIYVALFDSAVENRICRMNPARSKDAQPHQGTSGSHRAITDQERWWINHYCTDHRAHAAVMSMLYAGLRPQEVKALDVDKAVDFDAGTITLTEFCHMDGSNHYQITDKGKTDNAARVIPLFSPLRNALKDKHGYLISSASGDRVSVQAWRSAWESYVFNMEKAINGCEKRWYGKTKEHKAILDSGGKLPPWQEFTVVPYDLRHSFCTMCRDNGVELNTCRKWMGHADAKMILKIYDSVSEIRDQREAKKLETKLNGSQNGSQKKFRIVKVPDKSIEEASS